MLEELKEQVRIVGVKAQREGLCKHKSGNFSVLDADQGLFVITPSGMDREEITIDDMVVMDLNGNIVECKPGLKPSSEALMHVELYKQRKDIRAIVHTHSMYATSFAACNKPIPAIVYEMMHLNCKDAIIPVAPYARPGTKELAYSVREVCKEHDALLLESHGAVALDETNAEGAYLKACYIEEMAELYYHTLVINGGKDPKILGGQEIGAWAYPKEIK